MATILVVDDEKNYLWMLEELFQGEGYEVLTCERAEEALPLLAEGRVDLLLTDLRMAEMDGMALLGRVREMSPASSTIIMTAFGTVERAVEAMRLGAYDPFQWTAVRPALPPGQLQCHDRVAGRERTVRPRTGRLHRRHRPAPGGLRAGGRRDVVLGRGRRTSGGAAGEAPTCARYPGDPPGGQRESGVRGCPHPGCHPS